MPDNAYACFSLRFLCTLRYAAELKKAEAEVRKERKASGIEEIYVDSLYHRDARETEAEWLCLQACHQPGIEKYLASQGWDEAQISLALTQTISRAVYPASELKT
ncbi:MAG: hypothetical protein LBR26_17440 [Prevotella sp.]|jgi:hypothetical protein|nr:hypothetical protein [Prevotella sp.]